MFNVRKKGTVESTKVYDIHKMGAMVPKTYFLIFNGKWIWVDANDYEPTVEIVPHIIYGNTNIYDTTAMNPVMVESNTVTFVGYTTCDNYIRIEQGKDRCCSASARSYQCNICPYK